MIENMNTTSELKTKFNINELKTKFTVGQASATYSNSISTEDFNHQYLTYQGPLMYIFLIPSMETELVEIRPEAICELKERRKAAAMKMDERRKRLGPIGIKVVDLIKEAREERIKSILGEDK